MVLRHREPLPIPPQEIARLQAEIPLVHGSVLWTGAGGRILVAKVPGDEPDLVNDVEGVAEHARPSDVDQADKVLLVGRRQVSGLPVETLRPLVEERVRLDRRTAREMRPGLDPRFGNRFFRSPSDPKRRLRLAIRIPADRVADLDDEMLGDLADRVAPRIDQGALHDVHCVYLIAAHDDVRLHTDAFADDLLARWRDADKRRRLVEERERRHAQQAQDRETDRARLLGELEARYRKHVAYAPVRHPPTVRPATAGLATIAGKVDAMPAPHSLAMTDQEGRDGPAASRSPGGLGKGAAARSAAAPQESATTPVPVAIRPLPAGLEGLAASLEAAGFDVLPSPDVPGHRIGLAAERATTFPHRVIAIVQDRCSLADVEALLATARALEVDLAVLVAEAIEPAAARRIIATKVKHVLPGATDAFDI